MRYRIRDQTTNAFACEMGLTSGDKPNEDCTSAETHCRRQPNAGSPEVSEAVVAVLRTLAVPESPPQAKHHILGPERFVNIDCATCHRLRLPIELQGVAATKAVGTIASHTDLQLHDPGPDMADENASGTKVSSKWRTAPLWGLRYPLRTENHPTLLHDGRARSIEAAILRHCGEAAYAKRKFEVLRPRTREALQRWLATL